MPTATTTAMTSPAKKGTSTPPPPAVAALWGEVGDAFDGDSREVASKDVVDSLENALKYLTTCGEARRFAEDHLENVAEYILGGGQGKSKKVAKYKVEKSLKAALDIVNQELVAEDRAGPDDNGGGHPAWPLRVLAIVFDKEKPFYINPAPVAPASPGDAGHPEVRTNQINAFHRMEGFRNLSTYVTSRPSVDQYLSSLHPILEAMFEAIYITEEEENDSAHAISKAVMRHLVALDSETAEKLSTQQIQRVHVDLQRINKTLVFSNRQTLSYFHWFWRSFVAKLLRCGSVEHRLFGLEQIASLIDSTRLPGAFVVSGAGTGFVNGRYEFSTSALERGCVAARSVVSYERVVPDDDPEVKARGKRLKIHPCLMTEDGEAFCATWWYLSEADDSGGGVDYYYNKSAPLEHSKPPLSSWNPCGNGVDPSPSLELQAELIPIREGKDTLEQQLSKWILQNKVFDVVLRAQEDFMNAPAALVKFLSRMCNGNDPSVDRPAISQVLGQRSSLLASILPLLSVDSGPPPQGSPSPAPAQSPRGSSPSSSDYFRTVDAARRRLATAERWHSSTARAVSEYLAASSEVQDARSFLAELERSREVINVDSLETNGTADGQGEGHGALAGSKRRRSH